MSPAIESSSQKARQMVLWWRNI